MKKNIILMALAFAGLVACEQSVPYEPGAPMDVNGPTVYFSNTNSAAVVLASDATEFEIAVIRDNAGSALSVPLEGLCTIEGLFDVPATVEFPSGVDSVNVKIGVSDKIEMFETYRKLSKKSKLSISTSISVNPSKFGSEAMASMSITSFAYPQKRAFNQGMLRNGRKSTEPNS